MAASNADQVGSFKIHGAMERVDSLSAMPDTTPPSSKQSLVKKVKRKSLVTVMGLLVGTVMWLCVLSLFSCMGSLGPVAPDLLPFGECLESIPSELFLVYSIGTIAAAWVLDTIFVALFPILCRRPDPMGPTQSARWFFVHALTNGVIAYLAWDDVSFCFTHPCACGTDTWTGGRQMMGVAVGLHFYHIVFFDLKPGDWLHHGMTAILTSPPILLTHQSRGVAVALFFMTGLPGGIDYLLLTFVKLRWIPSIAEKNAYVFISVWIRGPGVLSAVVFGLSTVMSEDVAPQLPRWKLYGQIWNMFVTYWNSMFFMHSTLSDYYRVGRGKIAS